MALSRLDLQLRSVLPEALRAHVRLADVRALRLVFLAPTPAVASRLRLHHAELLAAAGALCEPGTELIVKVVPFPEDRSSPPGKKHLPDAAAKHLRNAAQSLSDHELRALFLELASQAGDDNGAA